MKKADKIIAKINDKIWAIEESYNFLEKYLFKIGGFTQKEQKRFYSFFDTIIGEYRDKIEKILGG